MAGGLMGGLAKGLQNAQQAQLLREYRDQNKASNALEAKLLQKKLDAQLMLEEIMGTETPVISAQTRRTPTAKLPAPGQIPMETPDIADVLAQNPYQAMMAGFATPASIQAQSKQTFAQNLIEQMGLGGDSLGLGGGPDTGGAAAGKELFPGGGPFRGRLSAEPPDLTVGGQPDLTTAGPQITARPPDLTVGGQPDLTAAGPPITARPPDLAAGGQLGTQVGELRKYIDVTIGTDGEIKFLIKNPTTSVIQDQTYKGQRGKMVINSRTGDPIRFFPETDFQQVTDPDGSTYFRDVNVVPGGAPGGEPGRGQLLKPAARAMILTPDKVMNYRNRDAEPVPMRLRESSAKELNAEGYLPANADQMKAMDSAHEMNSLVTGLRTLWIQAEGDEEIYAYLEKGMEWSEGDRPLFTFPKFEEKTDWKDVFVSKWWEAVNRRLDVIHKTDPKLALYVDRFITSAVRIARATGEVGTMTEGDIARAMRNLANPGIRLDENGNIEAFGMAYRDAPRAAEKKFQELVDQSWQAGPLISWRKQFPVPAKDEPAVEFTQAEIDAEMKLRGLR